MSARTAYSTTAARIVVGDVLREGGTVTEVSRVQTAAGNFYRVATAHRRGFGEFADDMIRSLDFYRPSQRLELAA